MNVKKNTPESKLKNQISELQTTVVKGPWKAPSPDKSLGQSLPKNIDSLSDAKLKKMGFKGEWESWKNMKIRCSKNTEYSFHPAFHTFKSFLKAMGPKPNPTYTLDRIANNNTEYSPDNCRWASKQTQALNKGTTVFLTDSTTGKKQTLVAWAAELKVPVETLRSRRKKGWEDDWILYGKPKTVQYEKNKSLLFWRTVVPDRDPVGLEQNYLSNYRRTFHQGRFCECREDYFAYHMTRKLQAVQERLVNSCDPCDPESMPSTEVQKIYDRYKVIIARFLVYFDREYGPGTGISFLSFWSP